MLRRLRRGRRGNASGRGLMRFHLLRRHWRACAHDVNEAVKQIRRLVWTGACLWVVLHAENWFVRVAKSRQGSIVQMNVRGLAASRAQRNFINTEAMILTCDFNPTRQHIAHWLIGAAMTKLQFPS
jgi:hypothetical protein